MTDSSTYDMTRIILQCRINRKMNCMLCASF